MRHTGMTMTQSIKATIYVCSGDDAVEVVESNGAVDGKHNCPNCKTTMTQAGWIEYKGGRSVSK